MSLYRDLQSLGVSVKAPSDLGTQEWTDSVQPPVFNKLADVQIPADVEKLPPFKSKPEEEYRTNLEKQMITRSSLGPHSEEELMGPIDQERRLAMTLRMERDNYIAEYDAYIKDLWDFNNGLDRIQGRWEEVKYMPQLFAWMALRKDDHNKRHFDRQNRRHMRGVYRDSQMIVKSKPIYKLVYHFRVPVLEMRRAYRENVHAIVRARHQDVGLKNLEHQVLGLDKFVDKMSTLSDAIRNKLIDSLAPNIGARQFTIPSGRFGGGREDLEDPEPIEEELPSLPSTATTLTTLGPPEDPAVLAEDGVMSNLPKEDIDPIPEVPYEEMQRRLSPYFRPRRLRMMFPYKTLQEGVIEHRRQDSVLRERHNINEKGQWKIASDKPMYQPMEYSNTNTVAPYIPEFAENIIDYNDPLWSEPDKPFYDMTREEKVEYIRTNFTDYQFAKWWRAKNARKIKARKKRRSRRRRINRTTRFFGLWKYSRLWRRKRRFRGRRKRMRSWRMRMNQLLKRVDAGTIRQELDPKFHPMFFRKMLRKYTLPAFFDAMNNNFAGQHVMKNLCGPYLYNRMERMRKIMEYQQYTSYWKVYRIGKLEVNRYLRRINGQMHFTVRVTVWAHYWMRDNNGRIVAGNCLKLKRQLWQFKFYRAEEAPKLNEHTMASKGSWKIGDIWRKRPRHYTARALKPERRRHLREILMMQNIRYPDQDWDNDKYTDQEFLSFGEDHRQTAEGKTTRDKMFDGFVDAQLAEQGLTREEWEIRTGQAKKKIEEYDRKMKTPEEKEEEMVKRLNEAKKIKDDEEELLKMGIMPEPTKEEKLYHIKLWGGYMQDADDLVDETHGEAMWEEHKKKKEDGVVRTFFHERRKERREKEITSIHQEMWDHWMRNAEKEEASK